MSAALAAIAERQVDPLDAFTERAWARAFLWSAGEYSLHEAVDALQAAAIRSGLIRRVGQDEVQRIMAAAFAPYREGGDG
jgi:hypothetical protein